MNTELLINGLLAIIGVGLSAGGIIGFLKTRNTWPRIWSGVATAAGVMMLVIVLLTSSFGEPVKGSGPLSNSIIDNQAIITGNVTSVSRVFGGDVLVEVLVQSTVNVGGLPNPVSDKVGKVVEFRDLDKSTPVEAGQVITANVRLSGDENGTFLVISHIIK